MSTQKARYIFGAVILLLAAAGAAWFLTREPALLRAAKDAASRVPPPYSLRVANISLDRTGSALILEKLEFRTRRDDLAWTLTVEQAEIRGLRPEILTGKAGGTQRIADAALLRGVTLTGPTYSEKTEEYLIEDIGGDLPAVLREWARLPREVLPEDGSLRVDPDHCRIAAALAEALNGMRIGSLVSKNTVSDSTESGWKYTLREDFSEIRDLTARLWGRMESKGVELRTPSLVVRSEQAQWDRLALPDFAVFFRNLAEAGGKGPGRGVFKGQGLALEKFRLSKTRFLDPDGDSEIIWTDGLGLDLSLEMTDNLAVKAQGTFTYDGVQPGEGFMLPMLIALRVKGIDAPLDLSLSGSQSVDGISAREGFADFRWTGRDKLTGVAEAQSAAEIGDFPIDPDAADDKGELRHFSFSFTDIGASKLLLGFYANETGKDDSKIPPQRMREEIAAILTQKRDKLPQNSELRKLMDDCAAFALTPGGTLSLALDPVPPLRLSPELEAELKKREKIGLKSGFRPGEKP